MRTEDRYFFEQFPRERDRVEDAYDTLSYGGHRRRDLAMVKGHPCVVLGFTEANRFPRAHVHFLDVRVSFLIPAGMLESTKGSSVAGRIRVVQAGADFIVQGGHRAYVEISADRVNPVEVAILVAELMQTLGEDPERWNELQAVALHHRWLAAHPAFPSRPPPLRYVYACQTLFEAYEHGRRILDYSDISSGSIGYSARGGRTPDGDGPIDQDQLTEEAPAAETPRDPSQTR